MPQIKEYTKDNGQVLLTSETEKYQLHNGCDLLSLRAETPGLTKLIISFDNPAVFASNPVISGITFQLLKSGTWNLDTFHFVSRMEETGVMLSACTNPDCGMIEFVVLDDLLDQVLPLVFEMITQPAFPEDELDRVRTAALQSWQISRKQTHAVAREHFLYNVYPGHPYGTMVTEEDITGIHGSHVQTFHQAHIAGGKPTFFVAAGEPQTVIHALDSVIREYNTFSKDASDVDSVITGHPSAIVTGKRIDLPLDGTVQSSIRIGRQLFPRNHDDFVTGKVITTLLGGYFSSRLMANLREDKGYTYGVGAGIVTLALGGYLTISADVGKTHLEDAIKEMMKEIGRLRHEKVDPEELQTVKQYLSGSALRELDGVFNRLSMLATLHRQGLDLNWTDQFLQKLSKVTPDDILAFSGQYFREEDMVQITCGETKQ